jgi:DNA-directed RNA polymerase subunit M/transcription elongation factor TFIIS
MLPEAKGPSFGKNKHLKNPTAFFILYLQSNNIPTMRFCDVCDNMLYHKDGKVMVCRMCGQEVDIQGKSCISRRELSGNASAKAHVRKQMVNPYTKHDPTLPHIEMPCKNSKSPTAHCTNTDIIAIRYDEDALKYMYLCPACDVVWTTDL